MPGRPIPSPARTTEEEAGAEWGPWLEVDLGGEFPVSAVDVTGELIFSPPAACSEE